MQNDHPPFFVQMKINITINDLVNAVRLDTLISDRLDVLSRSQAARLISDRMILVNSKAKKPGYRVKPGDQITGQIPAETKPDTPAPENLGLDICYEDSSLMVVNKKAGMVVHPAPGNRSGTLLNALIAHDPVIQSVGAERSRAGIVHRLDKDTSGLIVVAKTNQALRFLQKEFKQRRVQKKYLALVEGLVKDDKGKIELPISRHPVKRKQMAVNQQTGRYALSCWTVLEQYQSASFVEVLLKTGRTHQIRVHFYAIDHPLIGDPVYQFRRNRKKTNKGLRQMLHAHQLSFRHPYSGKRMVFKSPLPDDFADMMTQLRKKGR